MIRTSLALTAAILFIASAASAQDEIQTFNAFAVSQASGKVVIEGGNKASIEATLAGPFFVETDEGPVHSGKIACTGTTQIELESRKQNAKGSCTLTAEDGATSTGQWECTGYVLVGCRGIYTTTAGTGRLAGMAGEATMIWRPTPHELRAQIAAGAVQNVTGLLIFRDFKISKK
jgi:hypothetical protein